VTGGTGRKGDKGGIGPTGPTGTLASAYGYFYRQGSLESVAPAAAVSFPNSGEQDNVILNAGGASMTAAETGVYEVSFDLDLQSGASSSVEFALQKNGTTLPGAEYGVDGGQEAHGQALLSLTAGDVLQVINGSGTTVTISDPGNGVAASISIVRIS
jgi:hypothetical protein